MSKKFLARGVIFPDGAMRGVIFPDGAIHGHVPF